MSTTSKVVLTASAAFSLGTVAYVHFKQEQERGQLKQGIIFDVERQRRRQIQNIDVLQKQSDLTRQLQRLEEEERERS